MVTPPLPPSLLVSLSPTAMLTPFPAFVASPSSSGSALTALRTAASATTLTTRSRPAAVGYGREKGARQAWSALGGVPDGGATASAGEEERTRIAAEPKLQPAAGEENALMEYSLYVVRGLFVKRGGGGRRRGSF